MAAIELKSVTKKYGGLKAVDDLDLIVKEGEIFGFLGPNGSGKSTTIDLILDFARPTSGTITVFGRNTRTNSKYIHKKTGILPDNFDLYDRLTGREHLKFAIRAKNAETSVETMAKKVQLTEDEIKRRVGGYSKGMKQRLALGMALTGNPDLLILDEPSSGLDPNGMKELRKVLQDEASTGTTVFFSSHILSEIEAICNRVGILKDGNLLTVAELDELFAESGVKSTIEITCVNDPPQNQMIKNIEAVNECQIDGRTISIKYTDTSQKSKIISELEDLDIGILDIEMKTPSLEDIFTYYIGESRRPEKTEVEV
ncbi:ABC transporter ATP-binding protein [halophilic archaeon]|nr:ABC transporter ATP-binding protein [halophilic archaeon]